MDTVTRFAFGLGLTLAAWLLTRLPPRAFAPGRPAALALDIFPPLAAFAWFLAISGRPALSGVLAATLFGGFAFADYAKRQVLMEPVIFSDMSLLILMVRHPALYLAYVGYGRMAAALAGLGAVIAGVAMLEQPLGGWTPGQALLAAAAGVAVVWAVANPLVRGAAALARRLQPTGDPELDAPRLGALAMQLTHGVIARAERRARREAVAPPEPPSRRLTYIARAARPPVLLVQSESFFDARRLHPDIPGDLLPAFEACRASSLQWGRMDVRGRGGNTMRTEFDVLTGLTADHVGLDWRNPYHAFARGPVDSLAWTLKARGYRTLCIHPFDRRFFGRDVVMPNLGFDAFWGEEAFDGRVRDGRYIADSEVARVVENLLRHGDGLFLFVITVANHGPWSAPAQPCEPAMGPGAPEHGRQLLGFLKGLQRSDAMLARIAAAMARRTDPGLLAFFGDHLPSLPEVFAKLGFTDTRTDYLLWRNGEGQAPQRDCSAHELQGAILGALD